jgi:hypothetical protein
MRPNCGRAQVAPWHARTTKASIGYIGVLSGTQMPPCSEAIHDIYTANACYGQVVASLNDPTISFLEVSQESMIPDGIGCEDHPDLITHQAMADNLTAAIVDRVPGFQVTAFGGGA